MNYIFIYLVFPVAAYIVARDKNLNPWLWGGLALLIGPFALIIVAVMNPGEGQDRGYH